MTLGLSLIVKDETWQLKRLLESIKDIPFDEKVVVLTSSSEETKRIAEEFNCKTFNFKWVNDYSEARNFSLSNCTTDYVMWLDADDEIENPHRLIPLFEEMIKSGNTNLRLPYLYKNKEDRVIMTIFRERIVKKDSYQWVGSLHETCETDLKDTSFFSDEVKVIHHWEENKGRYERNLTISKISYDKKKDFKTALAYATSLADIKLYKEALDVMEKESKESLESAPAPYHYYALMFMGELSLELKLYLGALHYFDRAEKLFPVLGEPYFRQAEVHHFLKDYMEVIKLCSKGFYLNEPYHWIMPVKHDNYRLRPAKIYAYALYKTGHLNPALEVISQTINSYPNDKWLLKFRMLLSKEFLIKEIMGELNKKEILRKTA